MSGDDIVRLDSGERYPWVEVLRRIDQPITGRGSYNDANRSPITSFTAQVAEVSVDEDTGEVKLLRLTTTHDVGRVLNPLDHQGQIDGAIMQGVGYALTEELQIDEGRITTVTFGDYKIPCSQDIPRLDTVIRTLTAAPARTTLVVSARTPADASRRPLPTPLPTRRKRGLLTCPLPPRRCSDS